MTIDLNKYLNILDGINPGKRYGKVTQVLGLVVEGVGMPTCVGNLCSIIPHNGRNEEIRAEVVGFVDDKFLLMPLGETHGIRPSDRIIFSNEPFSVKVGEEMLGRTVDALGNPIDGLGPIFSVPDHARSCHVYNNPPEPFSRKRISEPLATGIRAIDGLITCGKGQRMGIFAGSGVGKSVLLGMIAQNTTADVNVIALIGERGREVRDFIEKDLGEEGLKHSVIIVATSDQPPLLRAIGPSVAMTIAEYFRDQGKDVLFMMDSVTRYAMAEREIGLAIGEPPTTKGYTPSVFAKLPKLLERAGSTSEKGTITALYTVLVEADDMNDPIADGVRSILDGHIVLSRELAIRNHYPAIEINESVSRLMVDVTESDHRKAAARLKETMAIYNDAKDMIDIGAYVPGSSSKIDYAIEQIDAINEYLRQPIEEQAVFDDTISRLMSLLPE
ncbi:FliI/YscN family ATPase [Candidatus Poribacteria bacterium]|nr:FliI/YscN family ATPase [Candidatus Poribacteria bacterium]